LVNTLLIFGRYLINMLWMYQEDGRTPGSQQHPHTALSQ
jgi:hypothetical protein